MRASKIIDEGVIGSPVMSNDGETVYINDRKGSLHAMHTFDGSQKWSLPLGFNATTPPSVAPDGTIIAGTGDKATLVGIKDSGAKGEIAWRRDDLVPLSTSSQAAGNVGYAVVRDGDKGLARGVQHPGRGYHQPLSATRCRRISGGDFDRTRPACHRHAERGSGIRVPPET